MLESRIDQGEGLRQDQPQAALRLITVVSQGDSAAEQPLLWQLCVALQGFGYPPLVLDGTSLENTRHPGLQDLLEQSHWTEVSAGYAETMDWPVLPAAAGLRTLAQRAAPPLPALGQLFRDYSVVVLYARAGLLIPLLGGSGAQPMLPLTPARASLVQAYRSLKQLQQQGRLVPSLVSLVAPSVQNAERAAHDAGKTLQKCAMTYLGCSTDMMTVRGDGLAGRRSDDVQRLALRLLEGALPLHEGRQQDPTPPLPYRTEALAQPVLAAQGF